MIAVSVLAFFKEKVRDAEAGTGAEKKTSDVLIGRGRCAHSGVEWSLEDALITGDSTREWTDEAVDCAGGDYDMPISREMVGRGAARTSICSGSARWKR